MNRSLRAAAALLVWAAICLPASAVGQAKSVPSIRRVQVLRTRGQVEIEIEASDRIVPQINVLTGPDRLVVDFVNAVPTEPASQPPGSKGPARRFVLVESAGYAGSARFEWPPALQDFPFGKNGDREGGRRRHPSRRTPTQHRTGPGEHELSQHDRAPVGANSGSSEATHGFVSGWPVVDPFQQSQPLRDSFRGTPANRG
jgi:hypothetical protein